MTARRSVPPPSVTAASHSVVDAISPEPMLAGVVRLLSAGEAQRLTQRIKLAASSIRDGLFKLRNMIEEAKASNAWQMLGFASWTAYLADTLGEEPMRVSREERLQLVGYLAGEGLSARAIAPIVGVSKSTAANDIEQVSSSGHVQPELDAIDAATGEVLDATPQPLRAVVGLDGKKYTRPDTRPVTLTAITDDARAAGVALRKAVERLDRIRNDERFEGHRDAILADIRSHLDAARDVLNDFGVEHLLIDPIKEN